MSAEQLECGRARVADAASRAIDAAMQDVPLDVQGEPRDAPAVRAAGTRDTEGAQGYILPIVACIAVAGGIYAIANNT